MKKLVNILLYGSALCVTLTSNTVGMDWGTNSYEEDRGVTPARTLAAPPAQLKLSGCYGGDLTIDPNQAGKVQYRYSGWGNLVPVGDPNQGKILVHTYGGWGADRYVYVDPK